MCGDGAVLLNGKIFKSKDLLSFLLPGMGEGEKRHNLGNHTCALQDTAVSFLGRNGWPWADLLATILCCSWEYRTCNETSGWGWWQTAPGQAASPRLTVVLHSHILPLSPGNTNEKKNFWTWRDCSFYVEFMVLFAKIIKLLSTITYDINFSEWVVIYNLI